MFNLSHKGYRLSNVCVKIKNQNEIHFKNNNADEMLHNCIKSEKSGLI